MNRNCIEDYTCFKRHLFRIANVLQDHTHCLPATRDKHITETHEWIRVKRLQGARYIFLYIISVVLSFDKLSKTETCSISVLNINILILTFLLITYKQEPRGSLDVYEYYYLGENAVVWGTCGCVSHTTDMTRLQKVTDLLGLFIDTNHTLSVDTQKTGHQLILAFHLFLQQKYNWYSQ